MEKLKDNNYLLTLVIRRALNVDRIPVEIQIEIYKNIRRRMVDADSS
ncbi:hypothetical protein [Clostridium tertium]|uniref:Uncharacterized protein n=1 Tax=Clostridium tertium TaxID=1559 RepID=A0A6N3H088_9CLOT